MSHKTNITLRQRTPLDAVRVFRDDDEEVPVTIGMFRSRWGSAVVSIDMTDRHAEYLVEQLLTALPAESIGRVLERFAAGAGRGGRETVQRQIQSRQKQVGSDDSWRGRQGSS